MASTAPTPASAPTPAPFSASDVVALASYVAAGGLAGVIGALDVFYPIHAPEFNALGLLLVSVAGAVRVFFNRNGAPATSIVTSAPVVPIGTQVTTAATPVVGMNTHS